MGDGNRSRKAGAIAIPISFKSRINTIITGMIINFLSLEKDSGYLF
jgi:hypothetical protein